MAVNLSPVGGVAAQFFTNNGVPLSGGKLYTYTAGTTTPQGTYTSAAGSSFHTNPIVLDSAGRVPNGGEIWLTDGVTYKFVLKDSNEVLIATYDNISGINSNFVNYTNEQEIQTATAGQTVFTLATMQYQPGTGSLSVFVDGVNQYGPGASYAFQETDSTTVTFTTGLHVGASVKFTTTAINAASYGDAFQISYTPPFTGSVATNVGDKLAQTVSVTDFGAVGDGVVDDTAAFNAAIAWANAKGGDDRAGIIGSTIYIPEGRYKITTSLNAITVSGVTFVGASKTSAVLLLSSTGAAFTFGNGTQTPVGGGIRSVKIEYPAGPTGSARIVDIDKAFTLDFEDMILQNVGTFLLLGVSNSRTAGGIVVRNVQAAVANSGYAVFDLRYGAGLTVSDCQMFVLGVLTPINPASMTTVYGTTVFKCGTGYWDTLQVDDCIFERFDLGVGCTSDAGMVYQNFFFTNVIMDYFRRWPFYLEAKNAGVISGIRCDSACWYVSWEESCVEIQSTTGYVDNVYFAGTMPIAGKYAIYANALYAKSMLFEGIEVGAANRLGTVNAAVNFATLCNGFTVIGCKGNFDLTGSGLPWRANYGISIGVNCVNYQVSNCLFDGAVGGYAEATHTTTGNRIVFNNNNANYAGYSAGITVAASGVAYTNKTGFTQEWTLLGGTLTGNYLKNGIAIGQPTVANVTLRPNDTLTASYSSAPTANVFIAS